MIDTNKGKAWTTGEDRQLVAMKAQGMQHENIARILGRSKDAIKYRLRTMNPYGEDGTKTERECLKCHRPFPSEGPGNRICRGCKVVNSDKNGDTYSLAERIRR